MPMFVDTTPPGQCIFCKLVAGEIPAARVYEDDLTLAFMDLGQVNPGHVLVATKRHAATLFDITPEEAAREIARGFEAGDFEIHFPKAFTRMLKTLRHLSYPLYFKAVKKFTKL